MTRKSNLTRTVINITQDNSRVAAVISAPQARSATENFESVMRMMHAPKGSPVKPGDTILDGDNYYVLAYFNITKKDLVFRMFITPIEGEVRIRRTEKDPTTGFFKDVGEDVFRGFYFAVESRSMTDDVGKFDRNNYRIITGAPIQVGNILNGKYRITAVRTDNGVVYAEAADATVGN